MRQIEQETRSHIENYQKWLSEEDRKKKEKRRRSALVELQNMDAENKRRLEVISELQKQEDLLHDKVKHRKHKGRKDPPLAHSTPKTTSEYNNLIQNLLNYSGTESDLWTDKHGKRLSTSKVRELQQLIEQSLNVNNKHGSGVITGSAGSKKCKEHDISSSSEDSEHSDGSSRSKKAKGMLKSGRCARVDNTDIKKVVRYPHSKLNREFVSYTEFDHLPLNIFAAGEIELILRTSSESEKEARLRILLMCLYHSQFLDISEIREQYDAIMKGIERGELFWADNLTDRLDRALDHRARVID